MRAENVEPEEKRVGRRLGGVAVEPADRFLDRPRDARLLFVLVLLLVLSRVVLLLLLLLLALVLVLVIIAAICSGARSLEPVG